MGIRGRSRGDGPKSRRVASGPAGARSDGCATQGPFRPAARGLARARTGGEAAADSIFIGHSRGIAPIGLDRRFG